MSKKALFVSDVHLSSANDKRWGEFLKFLQSIQSSEVSHLFLLGDIFDMWIADHNYFIDKYKPFIDELKRIQKQGVGIHYFEGNHDLYLNHYFKDQLGLIIHEDPQIVTVGELKVRIEHGDQMDPEDKGYIFLRWFLRTPFMKWFSKKMPESLIVKIGEKASESSRHYTSNIKTINKQSAIDKIRKHAEKIAYTKDFDLLVSGHLHIVDDYKFTCNNKELRSINLGSWLGDGWVLQVEEKSIQSIEI